MKIIKFYLVLLMCFAAACLVFISCNAGGGKSALVGRWHLVDGPTRNNPEEIELLKDGTGIVDGTGITWKTEKDRFLITNALWAFSSYYKVSGLTLTLTTNNDDILVYKSYKAKEIEGSVSIKGTAKVGQKLTADTSSLKSDGTIFFEWMKNDWTVIGTGKSYTLQDSDAGSFISVVVTSSNNSGSITSASVGINVLSVLSFTDELENMINYYYSKAFPAVKINYSFTPSDQFESKLDPVLQSGRGAPDLFALESAFVRKYVESGLLLDITDIYERNKSKLLQYPVEVGRGRDGKVYGMSWQACPGAMFYRRSLAKKYLGTDDPAEVQKYFTNLDKFIETAELLKQKSNGACIVVSSRGDLYNVFLGSRSSPWVVNGRLNIDPNMEKYLDMVKIIHDNRYDARVGQWSEGWFAGMKGELRDERRNRLETFSYFLPTWGLHYVLKTNAPNTSGDWAMIQGPAAYRWGGTWIGAFKGTKNAKQAKEMIEYLTTSDQFLEQWARDTGDVVSNLNVMNKIKDNFSEAFLGGQNHYAPFVQMAMNVDGKLTQGTDQTIENIFQEAATAFVNGEKTKLQALAEVRNQVAVTLGF